MQFTHTRPFPQRSFEAHDKVLEAPPNRGPSLRRLRSILELVGVAVMMAAFMAVAMF